jgi:tetratricopeptide (TPR) repeat protein
MLPDWWGTVLLNPFDQSADERVEAALQRVLERGEARLRRDPRDADGRFFRAAAYGFRGRLRSQRDEWIPAAWDGRRALVLIRELQREQPENHDLEFGLGLYDYFAAVVPRRYPIFRPLQPFFPAADRVRGLARLHRAKNLGRFTGTEAAWALVFVHAEFEENPRAALEEIRWLRRRHPRNPIFHLEEGRTQFELAAWPEVHSVFTDLIARSHEPDTAVGPYQELVAHYFVGRALAERQDRAAAAAEYREVERLAAAAAPRSAYRTLAWLWRGAALDGLGRREEATACFRRVLELRDVADSHKRARAYLRQAP